MGRSKDKSHILSLETPIKSDSQHQPLPLCFPQAIWLPDKIRTNNKSINQATAGGKGTFFSPLPFINPDILMEMFYVFYESPKENAKVVFVLTLQPQLQFVLVKGDSHIKCKEIQE